MNISQIIKEYHTDFFCVLFLNCVSSSMETNGISSCIIYYINVLCYDVGCLLTSS